MITLHHLNNSRSQRILWLRAELGVRYEVKRYQRDATTRLASPELKAIHPLGKSPLVTDGANLATDRPRLSRILSTHTAMAASARPRARRRWCR